MKQNIKRLKQLPFSEYQKRFFLEWVLAPSEISYNISYINQLKGNLNKKILKGACEIFIKRNKIVHSQFSQDGEHCYDGEFSIDDIYRESSFTSDLPFESQMQQMLYQSFDLTQGPLLRLYLIKSSEKEDSKFYFFFVAHHIICDANWVLQFFSQIQSDYNRLYKGEEVSAKIDTTFRKAIQTEKKRLNQSFKTSAQKFWRDFINKSPLNIQLPYRLGVESIHLDNFLADKTGEFIYFNLEDAQSAQLRTYAKRNETTLFVVLSALYGFVLFKYINQQVFFFSYPLDVRPREFKRNNGLFCE